MRLTIVGCAGSYPGPESPASSYLVEAEDAGGRTWRILLDLGNGSLGALHRYADPLGIDAVFLSHLHADHCIDMTSYYVLRKYHPTGQQPPLPVWGPKGTARRLAKAYDLPSKPGMQEEFEFHRYRGPVAVGPFTVTPVEVDHPVPAYGLRVEANDASLAYSGDTGPTAALDGLARDVDLFLVEASFLEGDDNPPGLHLTGRDAAEAAARAGAKRVVLTHLPDWHPAERIVAEARAAYDGPMEAAAAGVRYDI
jgi:ribonuclease BN (tRNA processing enzyme)